MSRRWTARGQALRRALSAGPAYRQSLASRILLLAAAAVGLAVAASALAVYATVRMQMQQSLDDSLTARAQAAVQSDALATLSSRRIPSWALGAGDVRVSFLNGMTGELVTADRVDSKLQYGWPELRVARGRDPLSVRTVTATDGSHFRVVAVPAGGTTALVLAQSLAPSESVLERLGAVLFIVGLVGMVIAGLAGWGVAVNGLTPVRRLTHAAEEVARTDQLTPIKVEGNDEIARLATSFNHMLHALSASRERQRQLIADAGHELRTPLTSLRTNLDLLRQADSGAGLSTELRRDLLDDVGAQMEELTTLVGDLVELARDEALSPVVERFDLVDALNRALARVRRRAPSLTFDVQASPWWVEGDPSAVERALTNLLDNAAKWSPEDGTVRVRCGGGEVVVDDEGPGIADDELSHVFDRFWRSPESRTMPGSGLGLSIVRQAITRHGGTVEARHSPGGGASFLVVLPGSSDERPEEEPVSDRDRLHGATSATAQGRLRDRSESRGTLKT